MTGKIWPNPAALPSVDTALRKEKGILWALGENRHAIYVMAGVLMRELSDSIARVTVDYLVSGFLCKGITFLHIYGVHRYVI